MKATSIRLNEEREQALTELAAKLKCQSSSGNPSWRVMLTMIADGFLKVTNPTAPKVYVSYTHAPKWWKPDENNSMPADDVAANFGASIEALIEKGFVKVGDRLVAKWKPYAFKPGVDDVFEPMMTAPAWFCPREDGRNSMPVADAVKASGMNAAAMMKRGIRIINGEFVTGPTGSEWAYEVPISEAES